LQSQIQRLANTLRVTKNEAKELLQENEKLQKIIERKTGVECDLRDELRRQNKKMQELINKNNELEQKNKKKQICSIL